MNMKYLKKYLAFALIVAMVMLSLPVGSIAYGIEVEDTTVTVTIKNSERTNSIAIYYPGVDTEVTLNSGEDFEIPVGTLVRITLDYKGTTPFPGAVKIRTEGNGGQDVASTNYNNEFYFIAGVDFEGYGIITEVTSWKNGEFDIFEVGDFDDLFVEYGTAIGELELPTEVEVTVDDAIPYDPVKTTFMVELDWDDGDPSYDGTENSLFTASILDDKLDASSHTVDIMVYILFYDVVDVENFPTIEQPYGTEFALPVEGDVDTTQWYWDDATKVFTAVDKMFVLPLTFDQGSSGEYTTLPYMLTVIDTFTGLPVLPVNIFNPEDIDTEQDVLPLFLEILEDLDLGVHNYLPTESEPTPPASGDAPLDNSSTYELDITWDLENIDVTDPGNGTRVKVYTGEWVLIPGITNPQSYIVTFTTSMEYLLIADDVTVPTAFGNVGEALPTLPDELLTPIVAHDPMMLDVTWGDPVVTEYEAGYKVYEYTGEFGLFDGLLNPEEYKAYATIKMAYNEISDDVDLGIIDLRIDDPDPAAANPVTTPVEIGDDQDLDVTWEMVSSILKGELGFVDKEIKVYEGTFINLSVGLLNTGNYHAYYEVHKEYYKIVEVTSPAVMDIPFGTPFGALELPLQVQVLLDNGDDPWYDVTWDAGTPTYDGETDMYFTGTLTLPENVLNPDELDAYQNINIYTDFIVSAVDPEPIVVPYGASLWNYVPYSADATFTDSELDGFHPVDFGSNMTLTEDITVRGDFDELPAHVGNPNDVHVNLDIIVRKVIIVEEPESEIESDGVVLRIGYNRTPAEAFEQLYYTLLPELETEYSVDWSIVSGGTLITLDEFGLVTGVNPGNAVVKVTIRYNDYLQYTEDEYQYMIFDDIPVQVIKYYPPSTPTPPTPTPPAPTPGITLDRDEVELEYGTDALEEFFSYDFTETITNSNDLRVSWKIDDEEIASVDQDGVVTAVSAGETTVTVTHTASGKTDTALVIVFLVGEEENPLGAIEFYGPYAYGYPDQSFGPQRAVTRGEVATMFANILGLNLDYPGTPKFSDVQEDIWYFPYIQAIYRTKIFVGMPDGSFKPDEPITRGEMATVFSKYWNYVGIPVSAMPDVSIIDVDASHWANQHIYRIYNAGIVTGFDDGTFRPNDATLREQVVGMINNLIARPEFLPPASKFNDINPLHWAYGDIEAASEFFTVQNELPVEEE